MDIHIGSVVVGIDGSAHALAATRWAAVEACRRGLPLRLVSAVGWATWSPIGLPALGEEYERGVLLETAHAMVDAAADAATATVPGVEVQREVRGGVPARVLVEESAAAALLVVGNRGSGGFTGLLLGSVGVTVAAHAHCPVVVVRGDAARPVRPDGPVVVGVGEEAEAEAAIAFAFDEAARRGVPLVAVHSWIETVVDPYLVPYVDWESVALEERRVLTDALAPWTGKYPGVEVREVVVRDGAARALLSAAAGADLVVVGSRGYGAARGLLLGSVSQAMLQHAPCPVAVVRSRTVDAAALLEQP
ncbi:UspA domain-containing protein [Pseudonocardia dioxanivorans CB1190]|jgi:nucleotide-binding universal stress UspA family protein|uniref:UspA domain-containing protein n=1 Tax=Pseudonocardia dioxanivorans (strain ATCC 55486 / DSM 44775 / JCM 13855 / CB1190) TaxID=675635 RepID=F4CKK9_PSEUX|nr:universal stress protein [Pseudonocardia dioxanivorans]AEA22979.1 UspA domain-containing protein [Pseudonocardia dioxanivorans CB1190]